VLKFTWLIAATDKLFKSQHFSHPIDDSETACLLYYGIG
jgi:hypothetical protein